MTVKVRMSQLPLQSRLSYLLSSHFISSLSPSLFSPWAQFSTRLGGSQAFLFSELAPLSSSCSWDNSMWCSHTEPTNCPFVFPSQIMAPWSIWKSKSETSKTPPLPCLTHLQVCWSWILNTFCLCPLYSISNASWHSCPKRLLWTSVHCLWNDLSEIQIFPLWWWDFHPQNSPVHFLACSLTHLFIF